MSELETTTHETAPKNTIGTNYSILGVLLLVVGGGLFAATGMSAGMETMIRSYIYGYMFWCGLTIGCFGLQLLHHTIRARWSRPVLRIWESACSPLMLGIQAVAFLPIAMNLNVIYEWMHADVVAGDKILQNKAFYLNPTVFYITTFGFFAFMIFWSYQLQSLQRKEDATGDKSYADKRANWAPPGLLFFVLLLNFFYTSVLMSLDPHWFSTIYGVWLMVGFALAGLAFTGMTVGTQHKRAPFVGIINEKFTYDIGILTLAFTLLWAYFTFSQFLITWSGNLPEFTVWFINRSVQPYSTLAGMGMFAQFLIPFIVLLQPASRRNPAVFAMLGGWVFSVRMFDFYYVVVPSLHIASPNPLTLLGGLFAMGGLWLLVFALQYKSRPELVNGSDYQLAANHG